MRVLVVDDSPFVRKQVRELFEHAVGSDIREAGDGAEALRIALSAKPDLISLDAVMPVMDGLAFARAYRASGGQAHILMVTSENTREFVMQAAQAGVNDFIIKPLTEQNLAAKLANWVKRKSA